MASLKNGEIGALSYLYGFDFNFVRSCPWTEAGDPLSHFLFVLVTELLTQVLMRAKNQGNINGVQVARGAPLISHLFFVDDAMFFCRAIGLKLVRLNSVS